MQQIWGPGNASNVLLTAQKRLIRPAYAQTQGYPYATYLDPSLRNTDNSIRIPLSTDVTAGAAAGQGTVPLARTSNAYTYQSSLIPGLCMVKSTGGEYVAVHNGSAVQTMGLLAQWVGGTFDNLGQLSECAVWLGPDSVYELLAPAWNDAQVAALVASSTAGVPVPLYAQVDGRLGNTGTQSSSPVVGYVMDRPNSARLVVKLAI
jgi:hypothetical protein